MACGLMKSCLSLCCWGSGHPAPFSPLFIPLTPLTLGFNFPWVFTACHCLHSEFRTGMKFGEITSFFFSFLSFFFFFLTSTSLRASERVVIARPDEKDSLRVWIGSRGLGGRVHLVFPQLQELFDVRWHQMAQSGQTSCRCQTKKATSSARHCHPATVKTRQNCSLTK